MLDHLIPFLLTLIVLIIGFIIKVKRISGYKKRLNFTIDFYNRFIDFVNDIIKNRRFDNQKYESVIKDVNRIQIELGENGIISDFRSLGVLNYQLFVNIVQELRNAVYFNYGVMGDVRINQLICYCQDGLLRHEGDLERIIDGESDKLYNIFSCLKEGIKEVLSFPFTLLYWFGILPSYKYNLVINSVLYSVLSGIGSLIGLVSAVMSIVLGYKDFIKIIINFLGV